MNVIANGTHQQYQSMTAPQLHNQYVNYARHGQSSSATQFAYPQQQQQPLQQHNNHSSSMTQFNLQQQPQPPPQQAKYEMNSLMKQIIRHVNKSIRCIISYLNCMNRSRIVINL